MTSIFRETFFSFSPGQEPDCLPDLPRRVLRRRNPYGNGERDYEDNADRFIFFCKAVVETMRLADLGADIVHGHDWQAALLPLLLREAERRMGVTLAMKTSSRSTTSRTKGSSRRHAIPARTSRRRLFSMDGLEYYGQVNFMKGGILFADRVTTVSPRYAKEIQTAGVRLRPGGCRADAHRRTVGVLMGSTPTIWNPSHRQADSRQVLGWLDLSGQAGLPRRSL